MSVVVATEKPLNQTQLKNLQKLVEGDFDDLKQRTLAEIDSRLEKRLEEIAEEFKQKDGDLESARKRIIDLGRQFEDQMRELVSEITDNTGFEVDRGRYGRLFSIEVDAEHLVQRGRDEAESKARGAANRLKTSIGRVLGREERKVQRTVLLQGITPGAATEIINDLPEQDDVLELVAEELKAERSDDMKALAPEIGGVK